MQPSRARSTAVGEGRPAGLGVAVVFDWALVAQLLTQAVAAPLGRLGQSGGVGIVIARLAGAAVLAALGELLRRGTRQVRWPQIVLAAALSVGGIVDAVRLLGGAVGRGVLLSTVVQLTAAPFIAVRLAAPMTARWFEAVRGRGRARRLCGVGWLTVLVAWSLVWGVAVAWSQSL